MTADQQLIACTLTAGDLRDRLGWIAMLNHDALRGYDRSALHALIIGRRHHAHAADRHVNGEPSPPRRSR